VLSVDDVVAGVEHELYVVVPVSSSRAPSALRPRVSPGEGIDGESAAICRGLRAVSRSRLLRPIGQVPSDTMREIERAVAMILGIDRPRSDWAPDGSRGRPVRPVRHTPDVGPQ